MRLHEGPPRGTHGVVLTPALTRTKEAPPASAETALVSQADGGTRTPDPFITSEVLYQLSYVGEDASA